MVNVDASFEQALSWIKEGRAVTRLGWNGAGQRVYLTFPSQSTVTLPDGHVTSYPPQPTVPFLVIETVDKQVVPWLASQTDLLANDWVQAA